jgi:hypothetical protein
MANMVGTYSNLNAAILIEGMTATTTEVTSNVIMASMVGTASAIRNGIIMDNIVTIATNINANTIMVSDLNTVTTVSHMVTTMATGVILA